MHKTPTEHPATLLSNLIPEKVQISLLKTPKRQLLETSVYATRLLSVRQSYKFALLTQWLNLLGHLIKLDDFDVENWEEELVGAAQPNIQLKIEGGIQKALLDSKKDAAFTSNDSFDAFVEYWERKYIPNEEKYDEYIEPFSTLPLIDKIEKLYLFILEVNLKSWSNLRKQIDKYADAFNDLRLNPIFSVDNSSDDVKSREDWFVLQDARVYHRVLEFNQFNEATIANWECLSIGIYEFDRLYTDLSNSKNKNYQKLAQKLSLFVDFIIDHDLPKRKQSAQRKREIELQNLLANRKRSSRLEIKEKRKNEEEAKRREEEEQERLQQRERRRAKRVAEMELEVRSSREERERKRLKREEGQVDGQELPVNGQELPIPQQVQDKESLVEEKVQLPVQELPVQEQVQLPVQELPVQEQELPVQQHQLPVQTPAVPPPPTQTQFQNF
ncbi:hypothetical protein DAMA08_046260 [Martiniozyma asiatica (nom. inval.)]|nr:hypothetical protein DAMA08_046260 [Martiniozyma asiatica]